MEHNQYEERVWKDPWHFLAFGGGLGTLPLAPGTWGTLGGVLLYLLIHNFSVLGYLSWIILAALFGILLCDRVSQELGVDDYKGIVWDEIVGYLFTMFAMPFALSWMIIGFILFRIFDVLKPWPINYIEKRVGGGLGIMLDDILAAIPAWIIMWILVFIFHR